MTHPYQWLDERAFWRSAVSDRSDFGVSGLWAPKYAVAADEPWVTFGSCFAQHVGAALVGNGFAWRNCEPPPKGVAADVARDYNYGIFSARTGNIYTTSLLLQWVRWSLGHRSMPDEIWHSGERFFDPFRPAIEPNGFASPDEIRASRAATLASFRKCIKDARYFVFTLGLTECWRNAEGGYEYPMCPGTAAGTFDPFRHVFHNMGVQDVTSALSEAVALMREANPDLLVLLTVSPVPLTATFSGHHVLSATTYSKSVLRAAADQVMSDCDCVDYFPSYELINAHPFKGMYFESNLRSVNRRGVDMVMEHFFSAIRDQTASALAEIPPATKVSGSSGTPDAAEQDDVVCEEQLLEAFGRPSCASAS